jgi:hypothetical protein
MSDMKHLVEDLVKYPVLTRETSDGGGYGNDVTRTGAGASLGRLAQDTIRAVLGWRYRSNDAKGFQAALGATAVAKQVDGFTEYEWRSPTFMVQADLGEITGAQASLLACAKNTVEQATPLLDRLTPLRADSDAEDIAAIRSIIRTQLNELVEECGQLGGPRVPRVDGIFRMLLGPERLDPLTAGQRETASHLKVELAKDVLGRRNQIDRERTILLVQLRERLGLEGQHVNTIQEERVFTDFLILRDLLTSLCHTWESQREEFLGRGEGFLGTELVRLSRLLDVIVESVHESYQAMDSVYFGPAERQTVRLRLRPQDERATELTVGELLDWVEDFCANEARQLIQDGGKDGVYTASYTLDRLHGLMAAAVRESCEREGRCGEKCIGFHAARVERALCEIATYLRSAADLAARLIRRVVRQARNYDRLEFRNDVLLGQATAAEQQAINAAAQASAPTVLSAARATVAQAAAIDAALLAKEQALAQQLRGKSNTTAKG